VKGYLAASAAFLVWGLASSVLLRNIPLPGPVVTVAGQLAGVLLVAAAIGRSRRADIGKALAEHKARLTMLALCFAGCSLTFHWSVKLTTVANAVLIHSLQPLFTALVFAPLILKERPGGKDLAAVAVGLAGMTVLLWSQLRWDGSWLGMGLALVSAVFFAGFNVQYPWFEGRLPRDVVLLFCLAGSFLMLLPFAAAQDFDPPGAMTVAKVSAFGISVFVLANMLFIYALAKAPVVHVSTLAYLEPVVAIAAAALWLGEPLTGHAVAGGALILASGAVAVSGNRRSA